MSNIQKAIDALDGCDEYSLRHHMSEVSILIEGYADAQAELTALREELEAESKGADKAAEDLLRLNRLLTAAEQRNAELTKERDFLLEQFREMAQAQPYAMVEHVYSPHEMTEQLDTYKWFWWNGTARPIYKGALCDVALSDGSFHFNVPPDFNWNDNDGVYVLAARRGPNLDYMEDVDRPAPIVYPALKPTESGASE